MNSDELEKCVPKDKYDTRAVEHARKIGFPMINPILPDLLEWMEDGNWPVAIELVPLLSCAGEEIVPHINVILRGEDDTWKYHILNGVVRGLKDDVWKEVRPEVIRISERPSPGEMVEEAHFIAEEIISMHSY